MTKKALKPALYEVPPAPAAAAADEHFICKDGVRYAGLHLIIALWGGKHLDNLALVKPPLPAAVAEHGAPLPNIHLHHFDPPDRLRPERRRVGKSGGLTCNYMWGPCT